MNRLVASFAALLLAASVFGGCTPKETPPQGEPSGSSSQVEENNSSQEDSSSRRLTVADAALYRGEVRGLDENGFYLVQVPGRDYGDGIVRFSIGEGTKFSFDRETLEEGQYLEVYYSDVQETYPPPDRGHCSQPAPRCGDVGLQRRGGGGDRKRGWHHRPF